MAPSARSLLSLLYLIRPKERKKNGPIFFLFPDIDHDASSIEAWCISEWGQPPGHPDRVPKWYTVSEEGSCIFGMWCTTHRRNIFRRRTTLKAWAAERWAFAGRVVNIRLTFTGRVVNILLTSRNRRSIRDSRQLWRWWTLQRAHSPSTNTLDKDNNCCDSPKHESRRGRGRGRWGLYVAEEIAREGGICF